jgi:glycosyltransferase involved in cell wall biosynthesis
MKIGFVWHCPYPWDVRLEKIMQACVKNGHGVSLLCRGKDSQPDAESLDGVQIRRVHALRSFQTKWIAKGASIPLFFNPVWVAAMIRFLRAEKVDLLIVRDLPMAFLVGALGKIFRAPVILDMAENYPAALIAYQNALYKPFLFRNAWLPKLYEKASLRMVDHTLVVTDEQVQRLEALAIQSLATTVIGNTPETCFYSGLVSQPPQPDVPEHQNGINLLFVGKLDAHRGVDLLIRVMPALQQEFPNVKLTLVGDGTHRGRLEQLAISLGLQSNVQLAGWVDFRRIWNYISDSTVCLIPHLRTEHTDTTLPNKLFDYMALGKPVIASDCIPIARIIRETGCGFTFASGDVVDLQAALRKLLSDGAARSTMGRNGQRAVREKYNWGIEAKNLLGVIETVQTSAHGTMPS